MSLINNFFGRANEQVSQDIITEFNQRADRRREADRHQRIIEERQEEEERMRERVTALQYEAEDARQRAAIAEYGRHEMYRIAQTIMVGALFFCFVLMVLLIVSGILF